MFWIFSDWTLKMSELKFRITHYYLILKSLYWKDENICFGKQDFVLESFYVVVQLLSHVWLFVIPWTAACQASFIISQSFLKLMYIELVGAIQPSHLLHSPSSDFNLSQHQGLFQWVSSSHQVAKALELLLQPQSFQWIFRAGFLEDWLAGSPCSPRDSQESSPTPQFKSINSLVLDFLYCPALTSRPGYSALTRWTFVSKVMSLLFNMRPRLVIAFLPRSKCLLISRLHSPSAALLESSQNNLSLFVSLSICHEVMGLDAMMLVSWMLSFKPTFSWCTLHRS